MNLSPFLLFEGNCAKAMQFYQSCLGGDLEVTLLRDTPMKDQAPASLRDKVAYARLTSGSIEISATDWQHQTRVPRQGNTVGLYLSDRQSGQSRGYREHWMQATLARYTAQIGWSGSHRLKREFPAKRPGGGTAYIDFLRMDESGILHIIETKIGHDEMLVLQGLDYWIWAQANAQLLADHFKVHATRMVGVDYVVGPKDGKQDLARGQQAVLSPYAPAQLEALDSEIDWQVHLCTGWATRSPVITPLGARKVPAAPYVHHRT